MIYKKNEMCKDLKSQNYFEDKLSFDALTPPPPQPAECSKWTWFESIMGIKSIRILRTLAFDLFDLFAI